MTDQRLLSKEELATVINNIALGKLPMLNLERLDQHIEAQAEQIAKHDHEIKSWLEEEKDWRATEKHYYERITKLRALATAVVSGDLDIDGATHTPTQVALEALKMGLDENG